MLTLMEKPYLQEEVSAILHPLVKQWFFSKFPAFSLPQLYGVMEIHKRNNILISAPTGATKTLTGFLSILNELVDSAEKGILENKIYAVYISPLKALNRDIATNLKEPLAEIEALAGHPLNIRVAVRTGDTTLKEKAAMLKHPPHILITTPETLSILLSSIKFVDYLKDVQWCIIDEIHSLAENKRGVHLSLAVEWLNKLSPSLCRIGLSATISPLEEIAHYLVGYTEEAERPCLIVNVPITKHLDLKVLSPVADLIEIDHPKKQAAFYNLINDLIQPHKTTLIFTNTRSATERVVHNLKELFPKNYTENIAAHHGSLSKSLRHQTEERLRNGELKCIVSSTSLELGIDIGYIDLVICLGSPKSVARFLQRIGRSGHKLNETPKGRIIVMDRDDLVECSVLVKSAIEKKIDKIHLPKNSLDVLAQQIIGFALQEQISTNELYALVRNSYSYHSLNWSDFESVLEYLAGHFTSLEDRHVYAKIWYDKETGMLGRRGKMTRVIYMTNLGTIPEETYMTVKIGDQVMGKIDEAFLERLKPGDIFVLGGEVYEFKYASGMTCQVRSSTNRPPTVPSWFSEMLPLSYDLAMEIGRLRRLVEEKFQKKLSRAEIVRFLKEFLYIDDETTALALYTYFLEQHEFSAIPSDKKITLEHFKEKEFNYVVFHTLFGRRVNDCLSRATAYVLGKQQHVDVEVGISDNGFYLCTPKNANVLRAFKALKPEHLRHLLEDSLEKSEVLNRRFRHCACRALMILREYKGQRKQVGRQQMGSRILLSAVKRISPNFSILKEARREVLEDLMDVENTFKVLTAIENKQIQVEEFYTALPSPFAFGMVTEGYSDIIRMEDKQEFLKRMHQQVLAKIALKKGKQKEAEAIAEEGFDYQLLWEKVEQSLREKEENLPESDSQFNSSSAEMAKGSN